MTYLSLIKKLDAFVRKYYRNKAIRGVLIATALLTAGFLTFFFFVFLEADGNTIELFNTYLSISIGLGQSGMVVLSIYLLMSAIGLHLGTALLRINLSIFG